MNTKNKNKNKNQENPVLLRIIKMRDVRSEYEDKWEREIEDYQCEEGYSTTPDDYRSKLKLPTLTAEIDSKVTDELKSPFIVDFVPMGKDSLPFKEARQKVFDSVWNKIRGDVHRHKAILQKNINGDGFIMALWRTVKKKRKFIVDFDDKGLPIYEEKEYLEYDDIKLHNVEPRFLLFDNNADDIDSCVDAAYDRYISKDAFLDIYGNNAMFNKKKVKEAYATSANNMSFETKEENRNKELQDLVNVIDYFNVVEDKYVVIANGIIIFEGVMPIKMIPIAHYKNRMKIGSFFSMSERDVIKDIIEEKDVHRNMIIDFNHHNIHAPIITNQGVDIDEESMVHAPGALWRVNDISQITRLPVSNIISAPFTVENMFDSDIVKATGVDINSLVNTGEESATKTITKKRNQLSRLEPMLKYNSLTADVRLVKIIMEYVDTFYPIPVTNALLDEDEAAANTKYREARVDDYIVENTANGLEFMPKKGSVDFFDITPDVLKGEFDVRVATSGEIPVSKELKEQRALELLRVVNAIPLDPNTGKVPMHIQPILKMLLESGDFNKEDFKAIFNDEQPQQTQEATPESILSGMGVQRPGNQQPGRAPVPAELQQALGQQATPDMMNSAEVGQLTAMENAGTQ